jgi:hypothetical protein
VQDPALALQVRCRERALALPTSCTTHCTTPVSEVPTFPSAAPSVASTCKRTPIAQLLKNGQEDLARQYAEKALALLDSHAAPASSWSDTEPRRGEIRSGLPDVLKKLESGH